MGDRRVFSGCFLLLFCLAPLLFFPFVFWLTLRGIRILFYINLTVKLVLSVRLTAHLAIVLRTRIQKDLRVIRRTVAMSKEKSAWILNKFYVVVGMPSRKVKGLPLRKVLPLSLFKACRQGNTAFYFRVKDTQSCYFAGGQELQYLSTPIIIIR